tara:strand:- start:2835 stop:2987 length:153 start_codon:yes stop_codon:yes gene_type:complete
MNDITIILLISTTLLGILFFGLFIWGISDGQFKNSEDAKYVIFRNDEDKK